MPRWKRLLWVAGPAGVVLAAVWAFAPRPVGLVDTADGRHEWSSSDAPPRRGVVWTPAMPVGELLPADATRDSLITPQPADGGRTLYFTRRGADGRAKIWRCRATESGWSGAEPVTALAGKDADDIGPAISRDGRELYLFSNRAGGHGGFDLYVSVRQSDGAWAPPRNLGPAVNGPADEYDPAPSPDGTRLYFASNRDSVKPGNRTDWTTTLRAHLARTGPARFDLFAAGRAERSAAWSAPVALAGVNQADSHQGAPHVSPDGAFLYFASDRPSRAGEARNLDLHRVRILPDGFGRVENLGPGVNTPAHETEPALSAEGFTLLFSRNDDAGAYALFRSPAAEVFDRTGWEPPPGVVLAEVWWQLLLLAGSFALTAWVIWMLRGWLFEKATAGRFVAASLLLHAIVLLVVWSVPLAEQVIRTIGEGGGSGRADVVFADNGAGGTSSAEGPTGFGATADLPAVETPTVAVTVPARTPVEAAPLPVPVERSAAPLPVAVAKLLPERALLPAPSPTEPSAPAPPAPLLPPARRNVSPAIAETPDTDAPAPQAVASRADTLPAPVQVDTGRAPDLVPSVSVPTVAGVTPPPSSAARLTSPVIASRSGAALPGLTAPTTPLGRNVRTPAAAIATLPDEAVAPIPAVAGRPAEPSVTASETAVARDRTTTAPGVAALPSPPTQPATPATARAIDTRPTAPAASEPVIASSALPKAALPRRTGLPLPAVDDIESPAPAGEVRPSAAARDTGPATAEVAIARSVPGPTPTALPAAAATLAIPALPATSAGKAETPARPAGLPDIAAPAPATLPAGLPRRTPGPVVAVVDPLDEPAVPAPTAPAARPVESAPAAASVTVARNDTGPAPATVSLPAAPGTSPALPGATASSIEVMPASTAGGPTANLPSATASPSPLPPRRPRGPAAPAVLDDPAGEPAVATRPVERSPDGEPGPVGVVDTKLARSTAPAGSDLAARAPGLDTPVQPSLRPTPGIGKSSPLPAASGGSPQVALVGGRPARRAAATVVAETLEDNAALEAAFVLRRPEVRKTVVEQAGGNDKTEAAVERGLAWIVARQRPDGRWKLEGGSVDSDAAATGIALLPLLGAGHTPKAGKHADAVARGLKWLVTGQRKNGDLYGDGPAKSHMYSHAIAAIALCEAFGMTRDPDLAGPAQRALDFIVASQDPKRGGWRYTPGQDSDTSVLGWQVQALKSGEMAGLKVPAEVWKGVRRWLDGVESDRFPGCFGYVSRNATPAMTAQGLLCLQLMGTARADRRLVVGSGYLADHAPRKGGDTSYCWYYAAQVMYHGGGEPWKKWNERMLAHLLPTQIAGGAEAGSWAAQDSRETPGGRLYATALRLLMLEVYYRHLPLYRQLGE